MTSITYMTWLACGMALPASIGACFVAYRSLHLCRTTSAARLSARLTELESTIEALTVAHRNLRSRLNMQSHRAKRPEPTEPIEETAPRSTDPDDIAASVRAELNGELAGRLGKFGLGGGSL